RPERVRRTHGRPLAPASQPSRLRHVQLSAVFLSAAELAQLARSSALRAVNTLNLGGNYGLKAPGLRALAESPHSAALESLDLSQTGIGTEGVEALAGSPHLAGLRRLRLESTRRTPGPV